jgi:hypothetical protein
MNLQNEYHIGMRPSLSASILPLVFAVAFFPASGLAQVNGTPTSVTSPGFGGHPVNGTASSVTSVGPRGYAPDFRGGTPGTVGSGHSHGTGEHHRHHNDHNSGNTPLYYAVPVPYAVEGAPEGAPQDDAYANEEADHQGGPTVFDRRGAGERSYVPPVKDVAPPHSSEADNAPDPIAEPEPVQPTVLVFKDGHRLEVGNYAIVGSTIFEFTSGRSHKIPLSDLNLDATQKENDTRGVVFQLPPSVKKKS